MTLIKLESIIEPMLSALYGENARCRKGHNFLYVWWGPGYTTWSKRYTKKEAMLLVNELNTKLIWI